MSRTLTYLVVGLLMGMGLVALAPSASAVGSCNAVTSDDCGGNLACIGTWTDQYGRVHCQYAIPYPCQYCVPIDD